MITKKTIYLFMSSIIFLILLDVSYQTVISPIFDGHVSSFGRYGYPPGNFSVSNFLYILVFIALIVINLPKDVGSPSDIIIIFYYFFSIIPFMSLVSLGLTNSDEIYYIDLLSIFLFILISRGILKKRIIHSYSMQANRYYTILIVTLGLLISVYLFKTFGAKSLVSSLLDVYDQRDIFSNSSFLLKYIVSFFSFGILGYMVYLFTVQRKYILLILILVFNIILFLSTGSKLIFGSTLLILIVSLRYKGSFSSAKVGFYLSFVVIIGLIFSLFGNHLLMSLLVRRTFILPAQIFHIYFDYFTLHDYNLMAAYSHTITESGYRESASHLIGSIFFQDDTHANSSIIADAYANFGPIGVILYSIVFAMLLSFLNKLNNNLDNRLTPILAGIAISFSNSGLLAVILYQLLPIVLIFYLHISFQKKNLTRNRIGEK